MAELDALKNVLPDIAKLGASLVVISPQIQRTAGELEGREPLVMEHLHDRGNEVARRYGLVFTVSEEVRRVYRGFGLDLAKANGDDSWTLPMPARFVIDRTGVIRSRDVDPDYTHRTDPSATIAVLQSLAR